MTIRLGDEQSRTFPGGNWLLACFDPGEVLMGFIFLILFFVLLAVWIITWAALHVTGGLIHLLLLFAVIALIIHLVRGRRRSV